MSENLTGCRARFRDREIEVVRHCADPDTLKLRFLDGVLIGGKDWDYAHVTKITPTEEFAMSRKKSGATPPGHVEIYPRDTSGDEKWYGRLLETRDNGCLVRITHASLSALVGKTLFLPPVDVVIPRGAETVAAARVSLAGAVDQRACTLRELCASMSVGRPERVRKRDAKAWWHAAGNAALPRRMDAELAAKVRALILEKLK